MAVGAVTSRQTSPGRAPFRGGGRPANLNRFPLKVIEGGGMPRLTAPVIRKLLAVSNSAIQRRLRARGGVALLVNLYHLFGPAYPKPRKAGMVDMGSYWSVPGHNEAIVASRPFRHLQTPYPNPQAGYLSASTTVGAIFKVHPTGRYQHWYGEFFPNYGGVAFPNGRWFYSMSFSPKGQPLWLVRPARTPLAPPPFLWTTPYQVTPRPARLSRLALDPAVGGSPYGSRPRDRKLAGIPGSLAFALNLFTESIDFLVVLADALGFLPDPSNWTP